MNYKLTLLCIAVLFSTSISAQVKIKIIDSTDGKPLPYANIWSDSVTQLKYIYKNNIYDIGSVDGNKEFSVNVSYIGFRDTTINVGEGYYELKMTPFINELDEIEVVFKYPKANALLREAFRAVKKNYPNYGYSMPFYGRQFWVEDGSYKCLKQYDGELHIRSGYSTLNGVDKNIKNITLCIDNALVNKENLSKNCFSQKLIKPLTRDIAQYKSFISNPYQGLNLFLIDTIMHDGTPAYHIYYDDLDIMVGGAKKVGKEFKVRLYGEILIDTVDLAFLSYKMSLDEKIVSEESLEINKESEEVRYEKFGLKYRIVEVKTREITERYAICHEKTYDSSCPSNISMMETTIHFEIPQKEKHKTCDGLIFKNINYRDFPREIDVTSDKWKTEVLKAKFKDQNTAILDSLQY